MITTQQGQTYLISPPVMEDFQTYDLPSFLYRGLPSNKIARFLRSLRKWAEDEYYNALTEMAFAGNIHALQRLRTMRPAHILASHYLFDIIVDKLGRDEALWRSLDEDTQVVFIDAYDIHKINVVEAELLRQEKRRKRKENYVVDLPRYDAALASL